MNRRTATLLIGLAIAVATAIGVRLTTGRPEDTWWAFPIIGVVLAAVLWMMLYFSTFAKDDVPHTVRPRQYAGAGLVAVAGGLVAGLLGDNSTFWPIGFIIAGAVMPAYQLAARDQTS